MQWYLYLTTIAATAVLGWFGYELLGRPIRAFFALRRKVLGQMLALENIPLPKPRELAVSSLEIREYDRAVADIRTTQHILRNLGFQLLAFGENEPATRTALGLLGFNLVAAGSELIKLSEVYPRPDTDRAGLQNQIRRALGVTYAAPAASRQRPQREKQIKYWTRSIYARYTGLSSNSRRRMDGRPGLRLQGAFVNVNDV
jgi:hypothetical protein